MNDADGVRRARRWFDILSLELDRAGLDLTMPFEVHGANASLRPNASDVAERSPSFELEAFGPEPALGVVIGNTRALWERVQAHLTGPDPLDDYVVSQVEASLAVAGTATRASARIYYAHRTDYPRPDGGLGAVPIQRLAQYSGLAALSPAHLSVHERFGPWIALRAIVVTPLSALPTRDAAHEPCAGCNAPCAAALERALDPSRDASLLASERWLQVRDACPVGLEQRYSAEQIRFHYRVLDR